MNKFLYRFLHMVRVLTEKEMNSVSTDKHVTIMSTKCYLRIAAVDHLYPDVQLHKRDFWNVRSPKTEMSVKKVRLCNLKNY